jgi:hypothetical protein
LPLAETGRLGLGGEPSFRAIIKLVGSIRISQQCFGLLPKLLEVDQFMNAERQKFVRKVHPELSFYEMNCRRFRQIAYIRVPGFSRYFVQMAACPKCYYPITKKAVLFESDYICPNCKQLLVPALSSVLLFVLLLLGIPAVTIGLFAFVFGIDSLAMMIGFFVLLPFGIYIGGTVIRYEASAEEPGVDVNGSEELNMAALAPAFFPGSYTWTFPGCPIQIRIRLEIVNALQRLAERAQDLGTLAPFAGGLLLGNTPSPGVTEVAGIEPLAGLDAAAVEAAIGKVECEVVGFFRARYGDPAQPGASLRMTDDDVTLAAGVFQATQFSGAVDRDHGNGGGDGDILFLERRENAGGFFVHGFPARRPSTRRARGESPATILLELLGCSRRFAAQRSITALSRLAYSLVSDMPPSPTVSQFLPILTMFFRFRPNGILGVSGPRSLLRLVSFVCFAGVADLLDRRQSLWEPAGRAQQNEDAALVRNLRVVENALLRHRVLIDGHVDFAGIRAQLSATGKAPARVGRRRGFGSHHFSSFSQFRPLAPKPLRNSLRPPRRRCITRQATFLAAYRKTASIAAAAKAAGLKPAQHYRWLAASPAYWDAFRELQEDVTRRLQDKVVELAMEGWAELVYHRGRVCGTIEHHSDRLLLYFLEGAKPEQWRQLRVREL